jgi:hypothetical protein
MTATADPTQDDIRYVRQLAESGAHAPLLGGRFMAWWGLLLTGAYMAHHLALNGVVGDGETVFGFIWIGFSLIGTLGHFALMRSMGGKAGSGSPGNRASRSVWLAAAMAIASMVAGTVAAAATGAGPATFDWIVPVAFAVYACALVVTGSLGKDRAIVAAGIGAAAMVGLFTALILSPDRYLVASAGVFLTVLVPGLLLLKNEPR